MAHQTTSYKCPACTGPLHFKSETGKLECEYCGCTYEPQEIEAIYADANAEAATAQQKDEANGSAEMAWNVEAAGGDWGDDASKMRAYSCPSCSAQIICDENTAATSCPYCGNPTVVPGKFAGTLRPDYVIPFKLNKDDAVKALKSHYKGKFLLPKTFTMENHINEIKGVYVPFWLFDGEAEGYMDFNASISSTHREGDYRVTEVRHYAIERSGAIAFERVPVDGSSKMPDDYMDSIEPYDYSEMVDFSTAYLPGYLADKYDVDATEASARASERCLNTAAQSIRDTVVGYTSVGLRSQSFHLNRGQVKYALLPVWMLSTRWNGNNYLFAMNGQTGRLVGDLPIDKAKRRLAFWASAAVSSAVLSLLFAVPIGRAITSLFA